MATYNRSPQRNTKKIQVRRDEYPTLQSGHIHFPKTSQDYYYSVHVHVQCRPVSAPPCQLLCDKIIPWCTSVIAQRPGPTSNI